MMAVMEAESTADANQNGRYEPEEHCYSLAVGDTKPIAGLLAPSCGLFQVRTLAGRPSCEQLKDPSTNVEWAYKIYKSQGITAWGAYTNGSYLEYL